MKSVFIDTTIKQVIWKAAAIVMPVNKMSGVE
jgi:hypothetical protein